jgi:hypothetical protein
MRIRLVSDERLSTGPAAAGSTITITGANSDECFALVAVNKATLLDENGVAAVSGDIGPAYASYRASRPVAGLSLSSAAPPVGVPAGTLIARITPTVAGTVTLTDDGGGRVALNGLSLVTTSIAFMANVAITVILAIAGQSRAVVLYPAIQAARTRIAFWADSFWNRATFWSDAA